MRSQRYSRRLAALVAAGVAAYAGELAAAPVSSSFTELLGGEETLPINLAFSFDSARAAGSGAGFGAPIFRDGSVAVRYTASVLEPSGPNDLSGFFVQKPGQLYTPHYNDIGIPNIPASRDGFFGNFAFDGEQFAFSGFDFVGGQIIGGTYTDIPFTPPVQASTPVAQRTQFLPLGQGSNLGNVQGYIVSSTDGVAMDDGLIAFHFTASQTVLDNGTANFGTNAIYLYDGSDFFNPVYTEVVRALTPMPDGSGQDFNRFSLGGTNPSLDGTDVAFTGDRGGADPVQGVYTKIGGTLAVVADSNDAALSALVSDPDRQLTFFDVSPSLDGGFVAFTAKDAPALGALITEGIAVYTDLSGTLRPVAERGDALPDDGGFFTSFGDASLSGGIIAFVGWDDSGDQGLFAEVNGTLLRIIGTGDLLDGGIVSGLRFGADGLAGSSLAFTAVFEDGTQGIYRADLTIPAPASLPLLAAGLLLLAGLRPRLRGRAPAPAR